MGEQTPINPAMFRATPVTSEDGFKKLEKILPPIGQFARAVIEAMGPACLTELTLKFSGSGLDGQVYVKTLEHDKNDGISVTVEGKLGQESSSKPNGIAYRPPGKGIFLRKLPDGSLIVEDRAVVKEGQVVCIIVGEFFKIQGYPLQIEAESSGQIKFVREDGVEVNPNEEIFFIDPDIKPV